jgi:hypothetical protein
MLLGLLIASTQCVMAQLLAQHESSALDALLATTKVVCLVAVIAGGILIVVHYCVPVPRPERNDGQPLLGESDRAPIPRAAELRPQVWLPGYQYPYAEAPLTGAVFHLVQPYAAAPQ